MSMLHTLAFQIPSMGEWLVIAAFGLLIFGKRLPEVGRSLGKGIIEFKKGLKGIEDDVEEASNQPTPARTALPPQQQSAALPSDAKFDPYTGKPLNGEHATTVSSGAPQDSVGH
ncbi:MAG TPA: twin-arginine translocase TatA/TatE family subunit [Humisphaera sp.]|nr:twin-arginine translocase TatA/TatE family subunit [Humisphaera sp.]